MNRSHHTDGKLYNGIRIYWMNLRRLFFQSRSSFARKMKHIEASVQSVCFAETNRRQNRENTSVNPLNLFRNRSFWYVANACVWRDIDKFGAHTNCECNFYGKNLWYQNCINWCVNDENKKSIILKIKWMTFGNRNSKDK